MIFMTKAKPVKHEGQTHTHAQSKDEAGQELQKKYIELQMLKQHVNSLVEQKQVIDEKRTELAITLNALNNLHSIAKGDEIWSTLGSGTFVKSDIKDHTNVLVAVGAGVVVSETTENAAKIIESRMADLETIERDIIKQAEAYIERINKLEPDVQRLAEEAQ